MKIVHFMTIDVGTGPVSLVEIRTGTEHAMLRIVHNAVFDAVRTVDPETTKTYVAGIRGARYMQDVVAPAHEARIGDEIARWIARFGTATFCIRWEQGRFGKVLSSRAEMEQYDAANAGLTAPAVPRRSQRIMA